MEQLSWKIKKSEILWPIQKDDLGINTTGITYSKNSKNWLACIISLKFDSTL